MGPAAGATGTNSRACTLNLNGVEQPLLPADADDDALLELSQPSCAIASSVGRCRVVVCLAIWIAV